MSVQSFVRNYACNCYPFEGDPEDYFVARLIFTYMHGRRVLDLGCGPVVPIMSVFYPEATEVVAVDRLKANLDFVKYHFHELDSIVKRAQVYRRKYLSPTLPHPKIRLVQGDVTKKLLLGTFHAVMNMGCFGALDTEAQFQKAVNNAYAYLKPGGTLLMVNWVGNAKRPYKFNGKADSSKLLMPTMKKAGFKVKEFHLNGKVLSKETRDMGYHHIVWAVATK